jgi:hypothetical protein
MELNGPIISRSWVPSCCCFSDYSLVAFLSYQFGGSGSVLALLTLLCTAIVVGG